MRYIKIGDILSVVSILIFIFFSFNNLNASKGDVVVITTDKSSYRYNLKEDRIIEVKGILGLSVIKIEDGHISFVDSECRDKLCIRAGYFKNAPIICMPNSVVIHSEKNKLNAGEDAEENIDAFVQ